MAILKMVSMANGIVSCSIIGVIASEIMKIFGVS